MEQNNSLSSAGSSPVGRLTRRKRWQDDGRDFLDTAAVLTQLDLVVTPDSSLAHMAGGLGVRVWVPLSTCGEWRWLLDREDSPVVSVASAVPADDSR